MNELGFRITPHCGGYQMQRLDEDGKVVSVTPVQKFAWDMYRMLLREYGGYKQAQAEILHILKTADYDAKALSMIGHWLDGPAAGEEVIRADAPQRT